MKKKTIRADLDDPEAIAAFGAELDRERPRDDRCTATVLAKQRGVEGGGRVWTVIVDTEREIYALVDYLNKVDPNQEKLVPPENPFGRVDEKLMGWLGTVKQFKDDPELRAYLDACSKQ